MSGFIEVDKQILRTAITNLNACSFFVFISLLNKISRSGGFLKVATKKELAESVGISAPTLSKAINEIELKGLISVDMRGGCYAILSMGNVKITNKAIVGDTTLNIPAIVLNLFAANIRLRFSAKVYFSLCLHLPFVDGKSDMYQQISHTWIQEHSGIFSSETIRKSYRDLENLGLIKWIPGKIHGCRYGKIKILKITTNSFSSDNSIKSTSESRIFRGLKDIGLHQNNRPYMR